MAFNSREADELLALCHRRCCICHRFCGSKMELDHMEQRANGGSDNIENAIPVCFDCHAEIHGYNDNHPKGRKFHARELKLHKKQWLEVCQNKPFVFDGNAGRASAGPLEAITNELEFNLVAATDFATSGCEFLDEQFRRATAAGSITILSDDVRGKLISAYVQMNAANNYIRRTLNFVKGSNSGSISQTDAESMVRSTVLPIKNALDALRAILTGQQTDRTGSDQVLAIEQYSDSTKTT